MADDIKYIVRGARMWCNKGTHMRKINLPISHGSYFNEKPLMNKSDRVVNTNICYFGICKVASLPFKNITLPVENGTDIGGTVTGGKCEPQIFKDWLNCKEDMLVDGKAALTIESKLVCLRGGKIKFITTGQEDE